MMMIEYGIHEIRLTSANADGSFPDFDSSQGISIELVVVDSFQEDQANDRETYLYVENFEYPVRSILEERGRRTVTFQTYDLLQHLL